MSEILELRQGKVVLLTDGAPAHVAARGVLAWDITNNNLYIQKTGPTGSAWEIVAEVTMTTIGEASTTSSMPRVTRGYLKEFGKPVRVMQIARVTEE
jgi:hypothetical protein